MLKVSDTIPAHARRVKPLPSIVANTAEIDHNQLAIESSRIFTRTPQAATKPATSDEHSMAVRQGGQPNCFGDGNFRRGPAPFMSIGLL